MWKKANPSLGHTIEKSTERIDGAVATIMGLDRAIQNGGNSTGSVYDERGILSF